MPVTAPTAKCPLGMVKGRVCAKPNLNGAKQVFRYSGIPFAKPPVGELRFEAPQKIVEPWEGVMDGTKMKAIPVQNIQMMQGMAPFFLTLNEFDENFEETDEDCLYLKIYTSNPNPDAKLPVMVWFYGGGFQMGGSCTYDGAVLSSLQDVVVVMPNYRVNVFGLLSFKPGETTVNGNMGLLDQCCALEWIRDNIGGFGGDPNNVTIFGESAGAGSVSLHVLSECSKGLFHKAISHSGVAEDNMVIDKHNDAARQSLLKVLNIEEADPNEALKKLKKIPAQDLLNAYGELMMEMKYFSISVDGTFLKNLPSELIRKKEMNRVPYVIGINSTEGYGLMAPGQDKGFATGIKADDAKEALRGFLSYSYTPAKDERILDAIWNKYKSIYANEDDKFRYSRILGDLAADITFNTASTQFAKGHSSTGTPTYFYKMSHQLKFSHDKEYQPAEDAVFKCDLCECDHGDDIYFTFGYPFSNAKKSLSAKFSDDERSLSQMWMGYLANFAKTGNPNEGEFKPTIAWEQYGNEERHLDVNVNPKMKDQFYENRYKFWKVELAAKKAALSETK